MRLTPGVALAVLLACPPGQAVELIDLQAATPVQASGQPIERPPAYQPAYFPPDPVPPSPPSQLPPNFLPYFPSYLPAPSFPYWSPQWAGYLPEGGDASSGAALADLPLATDTSSPAAMGTAPTPVPEPVSVLMLACGLLLMVPGAWAARWSRLGDCESLLQRRLP